MFKKAVILLGILLLLPSLVFAQSPIDSFIRKLKEAGMFRALISILFAVIVFAVLNKSKILGENVAINGFIAIIVALLIFVYPTFSGFSLEAPIAIFFTQIFVLLLLLVFAFIGASFFYPDLPKMLIQEFVKPNMVYVMIFVILILIIISRVAWVLWTGVTEISPGIKNTVILVAAILIFIALLYVAVNAGGG